MLKFSENKNLCIAHCTLHYSRINNCKSTTITIIVKSSGVKLLLSDDKGGLYLSISKVTSVRVKVLALKGASIYLQSNKCFYVALFYHQQRRGRKVIHGSQYNTAPPNKHQITTKRIPNTRYQHTLWSTLFQHHSLTPLTTM